MKLQVQYCVCVCGCVCMCVSLMCVCLCDFMSMIFYNSRCLDSLPPSLLPARVEKQHQVLTCPEFKNSGGTNRQGSACAKDLGT